MAEELQDNNKDTKDASGDTGNDTNIPGISSRILGILNSLGGFVSTIMGYATALHAAGRDASTLWMFLAYLVGGLGMDLMVHLERLWRYSAEIRQLEGELGRTARTKERMAAIKSIGPGALDRLAAGVHIGWRVRGAGALGLTLMGVMLAHVVGIEMFYGWLVGSCVVIAWAEWTRSAIMAEYTNEDEKKA